MVELLVADSTAAPLAAVFMDQWVEVFIAAESQWGAASMAAQWAAASTGAVVSVAVGVVDFVAAAVGIANRSLLRRHF
jgi:hypothetical protein